MTLLRAVDTRPSLPLPRNLSIHIQDCHQVSWDVLGMGWGWDLGLGLGMGVWGCPRTVVGNPR